MATFIADLNAHALPMVDANEYYIDHFDSTLTVFQTLRPENLSFVLNVRDPDTVSYEISLSAQDMTGTHNVVYRNPADNTGMIGPYRTGWLLRQGWQAISSGVHTSVNGRLGEDIMSVGGMDWLHYFARRQFPFNGTAIFAEAIGSSAQGLVLEAVGVDIATILTEILDKVLGKPYSWPITYSLSAIGTNIHYEIPVADQRFISDMISEMADIAPGFDYETTWDMIFRIASPYFFGDPTTFDITDPTDSHWAYVLDSSTPAKTPFDLEFTNNGPISTHLAGYGGSSPYRATTIGYTPGHAQFHRIDASTDFPEIVDQPTLDKLTGKNLAFNLQPQHEISVKVMPTVISNFWTTFKPGRAIWVGADLGFHEIESGQRIISMTCNDDQDSGEIVVDLGLNQVYDTHDNVGTVEG